MATWKKVVSELTKLNPEAVVTNDGQSVSFNQVVDLENFKRFQEVVVSRYEFVDFEFVLVDCAFAELTDASADDILNHDSYLQQPFGLRPIGDYWFLEASLPLRNLDFDDLVAVIFKTAWVADILHGVHT